VLDIVLEIIGILSSLDHQPFDTYPGRSAAAAAPSCYLDILWRTLYWDGSNTTQVCSQAVDILDFLTWKVTTSSSAADATALSTTEENRLEQLDLRLRRCEQLITKMGIELFERKMLEQ